ncbi:hypothetical protein AGLY_010334 [Aphis glycines]|uniref:PAX-interacting protein 1 n=1 Tax=Aphis glycines TaxID=307491 RepID=A0A6G0TFW4_APHGL|nr:hypothetical protein AGLY_010334 [Aphis glycines]
MFSCSICDEAFVGIHQDSTFTTLCGHVFHHHCLMNWLERSETCPHCRAQVSMNTLVKLFLQVDPHARVSWDRKTDEEIETLNLECQLKSRNNALKSTKEYIDTIKSQFERQKKENIGLVANLKLLKEKLIALETEKKKFELKLLEQTTEVQSLTKNLYDLQSQNSVIIDKLKSEIANLKSEKVYLQKRCHNTENINIEQPCTSKMCIENEIPLQNQTKNLYYGHDPQLHLTAQQFLLGCVFLIVELQVEHEGNLCNDIKMSKVDIIAHGGSVDQIYSTRITHVMCITQKHHIVEQAIKDGKRCVTDFWLRDVIARKHMIPPWLAHHFPLPYSINHNLPCQDLNIYIANFSINEYYRIKSMIELVGGRVIDEVTKADIIVSMKLEGELAESSFINRVVNVQWINDIIFGEKLSLKKSGYSQYQQFDLSDPFLVNYDMVPHLMEAWKFPISFYSAQKLDDYTVSPDSSTKFKRQKTLSKTPELINLVDDDNDNDVVITYIKTVPKSKPSVLFSGFSTDDREILKMILYLLGGKLASRQFDPTHLVLNKPKVSLDFFICLPTVKYVVNANWLKDSHSNLELQDEKQYLIEHLQDKNMGLCHVPTILNQYRCHKLFRFISFFITPGITYPPIHHLEKIISSAGGILEKTRRSLESIKGTPALSYFIISCPEEHKLYDDLSHIPNVVYLPEFITCSLLEQKVLINRFKIEMTAQN